MKTRPRRRTITAVLFVFPLLELISEDLLDLYTPGMDVHSAVFRLPPHPLFHVLTPELGFYGACAILGISIAFGPYLRGERWAWWSLLLADLAVIAARMWGTLTIYVHTIAGPTSGIIPELWLPLAVLALAVALSLGDFFFFSKRVTQG